MYRSKVEIDDYERVIAGVWKAELMARKRDPQSHPPTSPTRTIVKDTSKVMPRLNARLKGGHENPVRVSSGGEGEWPIECPVRIDVHMVMGRFGHDSLPTTEGLMGHIIDMDFYTKGQRVQIKLVRDPNSMAIVVNEEEIYRWVEDDADVPQRFFEVVEKMNHEGLAWADQVNLQPGDEVIDEGNGLRIVRAEDGEPDTFVPAGRNDVKMKKVKAPKAKSDMDEIIEDDEEEEVIWE